MNTGVKRPSLADIVAQRKAEQVTAQRSHDRVKRQGRYDRWHVPDSLERDQDDWLMTYMDLITLLLVLFIAIMALSRINVLPRAGQAPAELVGTLNIDRLPQATVQGPADMPVIPATWATLTAPAMERTDIEGMAASAAVPEAAQATADPQTPSPENPSAAQAVPVKAAPVPPTADELGLTDLGDAVDVIINSQSVSFRISNELIFPSGQALLNPVGEDVIEKLAEVINRSEHPVSVEGHSDPIPIQTRQFPSNWELSSSRATAVLRGLVGAGVASSRLRAVGYADTQPLEPNDTAEGRAANRRVELIMSIVPESTPEGGQTPEAQAAQPNQADSGG